MLSETTNLISEVVFTQEATITTFPVTDTEAKLFAKIDITEDDTIVENLIRSATYRAMRMINMVFISQPVQIYYDTYDTEIKLPYGPNHTSIQVFDVENGTETELTLNSDYYITGGSYKGLLIANRYTSSGLVKHELKVTFISGYADAASVPDYIKEAILKTVKTNYDRRNNSSMKSVVVMPNDAKSILMQGSMNPNF